MTLLELIAELRRDLLDDLPGDVLDPSVWETDDSGLLWTNAELVGYLNQAEQTLCRARPIRDSRTAAICEIAVTADEPEYSYDRRILCVRRPRLDGQPRALVKRTTRFLDEWFCIWETATGTPLEYVEDAEDYRLRLVPIPVADGTLRLEVERLPLADMAWANRATVTPEVSPELHRDLLYFAAWRAYLKRDSETYDPKRAQGFLDLWIARYGELPSAETEQRRRQERNLRRRARAAFF